MACRHVFGRHYPPHDQPAGRDALRGDIYQAFRRAGLGTSSKGTRILRHTTGTHLIQRGVPLKDIADVLGHRSIDTTAIYAKVDLPALREVALPWPEVTP
jgi:integrase/recombinase XerD